jgi:hypothetical protein
MATVPPGRNSIVQAAFAGLRAAERAEKKASNVKAKPEVAAPPVVHTKPAKASKSGPDVHKKAGKVHVTAKTKPTKKNGGRK